MMQNQIIAYPVSLPFGWDIVPAGIKRAWMDETDNKFAYRCLPMVIANQAGWQINSPIGFSATWHPERPVKESIEFVFDQTDLNFETQIVSHFGSGIITFTIPYLFKTFNDISLLVRGLPNCFKSNCSALEGLVETFWNLSTFTMNWKIHEPKVEVAFKKGEPICFVQPIQISLIESFSAKMANLDTAPELAASYNAWAASRKEFNDSPTRGNDWQKHYHSGVTLNGSKIEGHFSKLNLPQFLSGG